MVCVKGREGERMREDEREGEEAKEGVGGERLRSETERE